MIQAGATASPTYRGQNRMIEMDVRIGEVCYRERLRLCGRMQQSRWAERPLTLGLYGEQIEMLATWLHELLECFDTQSGLLLESSQM
mgnify:FL=1